MLVARVRRAAPLVERALHEAATQQPHRGAITVGPLRAVVIDDQRLRNGLGALLEAGTLPLRRCQSVIDLLSSRLELGALGIRGLASQLRGVASVEGCKAVP